MRKKNLRPNPIRHRNRRPSPRQRLPSLNFLRFKQGARGSCRARQARKRRGCQLSPFFVPPTHHRIKLFFGSVANCRGASNFATLRRQAGAFSRNSFFARQAAIFPCKPQGIGSIAHRKRVDKPWHRNCSNGRCRTIFLRRQDNDHRQKVSMRGSSGFDVRARRMSRSRPARQRRIAGRVGELGGLSRTWLNPQKGGPSPLFPFPSAPRFSPSPEASVFSSAIQRFPCRRSTPACRHCRAARLTLFRFSATFSAI